MEIITGSCVNSQRYVNNTARAQRAGRIANATAIRIRLPYITLCDSSKHLSKPRDSSENFLK